MGKASKEEILAIAKNSPQATRDNIQPIRFAVVKKATGEKRVFNKDKFMRSMKLVGLLLLLEFGFAKMIVDGPKINESNIEQQYRGYNEQMKIREDQIAHENAVEEYRAREVAEEAKRIEAAQNAADQNTVTR